MVLLPTKWRIVVDIAYSMRYFTGQYERTIDVKKRIQIPSQLRSGIDPQRDGTGLYVVLGEYRGTLSVYTERGFNELAGRTGKHQDALHNRPGT